MLFPPPGKGVPGGPADARTPQQPPPPFLPQLHVRRVKSSTLAACPWLPARRSALLEKWSFPFFSHVHFSSMCCRGGTSCSLNIVTAGVSLCCWHCRSTSSDKSTEDTFSSDTQIVNCFIGSTDEWWRWVELVLAVNSSWNVPLSVCVNLLFQLKQYFLLRICSISGKKSVLQTYPFLTLMRLKYW